MDRRPFLLAQLAEAFGRAGEIDEEVTRSEAETQRLRNESERLRQIAATRTALQERIGHNERDLADLQQDIAHRGAAGYRRGHRCTTTRDRSGYDGAGAERAAITGVRAAT